MARYLRGFPWSSCSLIWGAQCLWDASSTGLATAGRDPAYMLEDCSTMWIAHNRLEIAGTLLSAFEIQIKMLIWVFSICPIILREIPVLWDFIWLLYVLTSVTDEQCFDRICLLGFWLLKLFFKIMTNPGKTTLFSGWIYLTSAQFLEALSTINRCSFFTVEA